MMLLCRRVNSRDHFRLCKLLFTFKSSNKFIAQLLRVLAMCAARPAAGVEREVLPLSKSGHFLRSVKDESMHAVVHGAVVRLSTSEHVWTDAFVIIFDFEETTQLLYAAAASWRRGSSRKTSLYI